MFGGNIVPPPSCKTITKRDATKQDILAPSPTPGYYGHYARQPNTDQSVRMLHYQQQKGDEDKNREEHGKQQKLNDAITTNFEQHAVKKQYQRLVEEKVQQKLNAYEAAVEARRHKLQDLLNYEERQYYYETVDAAQRGADKKMEEMKLKAEMLKAKREAERLDIVHEKRIEQYRDRCQEVRPLLAKKHLMESKYAQLQQIRENEARREADRELDKMWHELTMKEIDAKKEREIREMLEKRNKEKETQKTWDMQIKGKKLLKQEINRVAQEDKLELEKLSEQIRREEIEALDAKRRQRDETSRQILEQIQIQKQLNDQRKKEENALDQAFATLTQLEIDREKAAIHDTSEKAKRETVLYRKHLKELEKERQLEEKKLMELLEIHRKQVEAKMDEARCKIVIAKRKLQQDVLAERADQIRYKKQEAEQQLKLKEAENELLRMAYETNERLQAESDRLERQAALKYREDLKNQIEYNNVLRQRDKDEIERQLAEGLKEEERYRKIVELMLVGDVETNGNKHPFRKALEQHDCRCPN